jgi:hypothetical protein
MRIVRHRSWVVARTAGLALGLRYGGVSLEPLRNKP